MGENPGYCCPLIDFGSGFPVIALKHGERPLTSPPFLPIYSTVGKLIYFNSAQNCKSKCILNRNSAILGLIFFPALTKLPLPLIRGFGVNCFIYFFRK